MRLLVSSPLRRKVCGASVWAIAGWLSALSMAAAAPHTLTIEDAMRAARAQAPSVMAQSARITAAREDAARAAALPDPTLQVGIDDLTATGSQAFHLGADDMTMRRIGLMQDWPSRRKRDARRAAADAEVDTLLSESTATQLMVERRAGEAWIEVWVAEAESASLRELIDEAERAIRIAEAQLANGTGTPATALAAKSGRAELEHELRAARAQEQAARAGLTRWLGERGQMPLGTLADFDVLRAPPEQLRAALDRHAALQVWDRRERAAESAVRLAQADKRPDLGFGLSYGARSADLPDMVTFEVRVGLPLFPRNRQDRNVAARSAEREAVQAEHEDARRQQREELERQLALWRGLVDARTLYESTLLPLARDRSAVSLASYGGGGEIQPWLEARREEIATRRRHLQTRADLGRAWLVLETLMPREAATLETTP